MSDAFKVRIEFEKVMQSGIGYSTGGRLAKGFTCSGDFGGSFTVLVGHEVQLGYNCNDKTVSCRKDLRYLDIELNAQNKQEAQNKAIKIAQKLIEITTFLYNTGMVLNLQSATTVNLSTQQSTALSDSLSVVSELQCGGDQVLEVFEKLSQIADPGLKTAIELGLEWVYLARITTDSRNCFLAYWTALELILTQLPPKEEAMFTKYVAPGCVEQMKSELDAVLEKYICNADARSRLSQYIRQAKATSDIDRWVEALNEIGAKFQGKPIVDSQLKEFKIYRDTLVHNGGIVSERYKKKIPENPLKNVPIFEIKEIVTCTLNKLLCTNSTTNKE